MLILKLDRTSCSLTPNIHEMLNDNAKYHLPFAIRSLNLFSFLEYFLVFFSCPGARALKYKCLTYSATFAANPSRSIPSVSPLSLVFPSVNSISAGLQGRLPLKELFSALGVSLISTMLDGLDIGLDFTDCEERASGGVEGGFGKFMAVKEFEDDGGWLGKGSLGVPIEVPGLASPEVFLRFDG